MNPIQISFFGQPKLKQLREDQHPSYRVSRHAQSCSYRELLAALVRGRLQIEVADVIAAHYPTPIELKRATVAGLSQLRNVGPATAATIIAAIELGRQMATASPLDRVSIHNPADAAALVQYEMSSLEKEELRVILVDTRNRVMDIETVYHGSANQAQVRVAEVFQPVIRKNATQVVVVHNHPSGDPTPSPEDVAVTRSLVQAGKLLDIEVLDHLIIGREKFVSMKERGLGFS